MSTEKNSAAIAIAGASLIPAEVVMNMFHGGLVGGALGLFAAGLVYVAVDEAQKNGKEISLPLPVLHRQEREPNEMSFLYRVTHGKDSRDEMVQSQLKDGRDDPQTDKLPDVSFDIDGIDDLRPLRGNYFLFSEVLNDFRPTIDRIFLARTDDNEDLHCRVRDLCHVALAGNTGGGKSSLMRMLMLQLCATRMQVLLLNPHHTRYDLESYGPDGKPCPEDWTPFEPYLVDDPIRCMQPAVIEHYLKAAAKDLIPRRLERRAKGQPVGKPYFIVIDELPSIVKSVEAAPDYMGTILREGRKVGVFLISASQDFLVKTISPKDGGGSLRECYRTAYYVGGDATTAKVLLDMQAKDIHEDELGKGAVMLRGGALKKAGKVFVPYVDNEALYKLLGPSTYKQPVMSSGVDLPLNDPVNVGAQTYREISYETPLNDTVNYQLNGAGSPLTTSDDNQHLSLINKPSEPFNEHREGRDNARLVNVNASTQGVSAEKRELIKRLNDMGAMTHSMVAKAVKLDGPKYAIYKQVCAEEGIEIK